MENPYLPYLARLEKVTTETWDTKTFRCVFDKPEVRDRFHYWPGQFLETSVFGVGESTFGISNSATRPGFVEFSVKKMGIVTSALHELEEGEVVGIRGPFGNWFPYDEIKGKKLLFIGGGIGMAPLRSLINFCVDNRSDYGDMQILYGARTPGDLCYRSELEEWKQVSGVDVRLTVDRGDENWSANVGFVPAYLMDLAPSPADTVAITCGPPIMIRFVIENLLKLQFTDDQIITTLENRMKCGIGKCGRCNIGNKYVCIDGPVFSYAQIRNMLPEF